MHTIYLACDIDTNETTDKIAAWEVMKKFNNVFGEISGTVLTSTQPDASFVMQLNIHNIDRLDGISQAKLNKLVNDLKKIGSITDIDVHKETIEEKEIFAEYQKTEKDKIEVEEKTLDEDLGPMSLIDLTDSEAESEETDLIEENDQKNNFSPN